VNYVNACACHVNCETCYPYLSLFLPLEGTYFYKNGDVYSGSWLNGIRHGAGAIVYTTGETYTGNYQESLASGHGEYKFLNGDVYTGTCVYALVVSSKTLCMCEFRRTLCTTLTPASSSPATATTSHASVCRGVQDGYDGRARLIYLPDRG
jgi:hypothetical protein